MRIAVAGGTGAVGKYVVEAARQAGHEVVSISRRSGVDVRTGAGLFEALQGVEVIIDTTNAGTTKRAEATAFFTEVAGQLQATGAAQGVSRLVVLSIVGLERVPGFGYYEAKLAQEAAFVAGPLPVSLVRATQFHEFPAQILSRVGLGPFALVPIMRIQPVAARGWAKPSSGSRRSPPRRPSRSPGPRRRTWSRWLAPSSAHAGLEGWWCRSRSRAVPERPCAAAVSSRRPGRTSSARRLRSGWREKIWRPCPRESCESPRQVRAKAARGRNASLGRRCKWR